MTDQVPEARQTTAPAAVPSADPSRAEPAMPGPAPRGSRPRWVAVVAVLTGVLLVGGGTAAGFGAGYAAGSHRGPAVDRWADEVPRAVEGRVDRERNLQPPPPDPRHDRRPRT